MPPASRAPTSWTRSTSWASRAPHGPRPRRTSPTSTGRCATVPSRWRSSPPHRRGSGPDTPACLTFTSGSTGEPKAVLGRHGSLTHFLPWQSERFGVTADDRFSMLSGLAHDPIQRDMFWPLWVGATIVVPDPDADRFAGLAGGLAPARTGVGGAPHAGDGPADRRAGVHRRHRRRRRSARSGWRSFIGDVLTQGDVERFRALAPRRHGREPVRHHRDPAGQRSPRRARRTLAVTDEPRAATAGGAAARRRHPRRPAPGALGTRGTRSASARSARSACAAPTSRSATSDRPDRHRGPVRRSPTRRPWRPLLPHRRPGPLRAPTARSSSSVATTTRSRSAASAIELGEVRAALVQLGVRQRRGRARRRRRRLASPRRPRRGGSGGDAHAGRPAARLRSRAAGPHGAGRHRGDRPSIPLTPNGKLDRAALPPPDRRRRGRAGR